MTLYSKSQCIQELPSDKSFYTPNVFGYDWWTLVFPLTILLLAFRHVVAVVFLTPIATRFVGGGLTAIHSTGELKKNPNFGKGEGVDREVLIRKFVKYEWHLLFYIPMWPFVLWTLSNLSWSIYNSKDYDLGLIGGTNERPFHSPNDKFVYCDMQQYVLLIFALEFAWYLHGVVETCVFDHKRGDFLMMLAHHVLAGFLIYCNVIFSAHRIGLYVLAILDIGDIVLYSAKMFHLSTSNAHGRAINSRCQKGQTAMLTFVAIIWTLTRMVGFSALVYYTWIIDLPPEERTAKKMIRLVLTIILFLQYVWGIALYRMVYAQYREGKFDDVINDEIKTKEEIKKDK